MLIRFRCRFVSSLIVSLCLSVPHPPIPLFSIFCDCESMICSCVEERPPDVPAISDLGPGAEIPTEQLRLEEAEGRTPTADESDRSADQNLVSKSTDEGEEGEAEDR